MVIQNQTGNYPRRWDKTGVVIKAMGFDQYQVMTHGSRKITLRNRKFLRKIDHPSKRFTYSLPDVIPSSPAQQEQPQPLSQPCPPDLPRPITPTPVPLTPEPRSPNQEESFFTPQQSPSIRVNQQQFDERMDAARDSPTPHQMLSHPHLLGKNSLNHCLSPVLQIFRDPSLLLLHP